MAAMYCGYAERMGFVFDCLEDATNKTVLKIEGSRVFEAFCLESGIHRIQRVPPTEKKGRRQTSTIAVAVLECPDSSECSIPQSDIKTESTRGNGPGGQHRNTRDTAVRVTHIPTGMQAYADGRSQYTNKKNALAALAARVAEVAVKHDKGKANSSRRDQIGHMGRGSRVRTYNLFRGFVKDERVPGKHKPDKILSGELDRIYSKLR